ncbi:MAG: hypothetical protein HY698_15530 [Deltaproteobacteria bacterium]|nr:hypothetical protein [Deltaproteobacteria bacterium]
MLVTKRTLEPARLALVAFITIFFVAHGLAAAAGSKKKPRGPAAKDPCAETEKTVEQALSSKNQGDLEAALVALETTQKECPHPRLAFNIARVKEDLGRYRESYEGFLRVAAMPGVESSVRDLAELRAGELRPRADKPVLRATRLPDEGVVTVSGERIDGAGTEKVLLAEDNSVIWAGGDGRVLMRAEKYPSGQRTDVDFVDLLGKETGWLEWPKEDPGRAAWVDGVAIPVGLFTLRRLELPPGAHSVRIERAEGAPIELQVEVQAGHGQELAAAIAAATRVGEAREPKEPAHRKSLGILPAATASAGLIIAGAGAWILKSSEDTADEYRKEIAKPYPDMTRALDLYDSHADKKQKGTITLGVGTAVVVGGVSWWLLERYLGEESPRVSLEVTPSGSVHVRGSF